MPGEACQKIDFDLKKPWRVLPDQQKAEGEGRGRWPGKKKAS